MEWGQGKPNSNEAFWIVILVHSCSKTAVLLGTCWPHSKLSSSCIFTQQKEDRHLMSQHRTALQRCPGWTQNRKESCCTWAAVPKIISPENRDFSFKIYALMTKRNFCDRFLIWKKNGFFLPTNHPIKNT